MPEIDTDWERSVGAVVMRGDKVLLVRHTYGAGAGMLIIPGGYVKHGETPQDAVVREVMEETGITVRPDRLAGIRFNMKDWYAVFTAEYISGEARSDGDENSEAVWVYIPDIALKKDVPDLTKKIVESVVSADKNGGGLYRAIPYKGRENNGEYSFYSF